MNDPNTNIFLRSYNNCAVLLSAWSIHYVSTKLSCSTAILCPLYATEKERKEQALALFVRRTEI